MTEIGEGVSINLGKNPEVPDLDDTHWLEVEYVTRTGAPIYGSFRATDSEGMLWSGQLNDQGQACLAGLPDGEAQVEFLPEENTDRQLSATRQEIQGVLERIVADQKEQAAQHEAELAQQSGIQRSFTHVHSFGRGLWNGAVGLVEFVATSASKAAEFAHYILPLNQMQNLLSAGYQSYQDGELTWKEWSDSLADNLQQEHQEDIARLLGVEPEDVSRDGMRQAMNKVTEAYDIAAFIASDPESREMLTQFAQDMADAQSSLDWAEFAGAGVFEIVLAALLAIFTGGAGNAAQAASKLRHTAHLRRLGHLFQKLARLLRQKKFNKRLTAPVDQKTTTQVDLPDIIELRPREPYPSMGAPPGTRIGAPRPTQADVGLAKSSGTSAAIVAARKKVAEHYMENNGFSKNQIDDALGSADGSRVGGVDLAKPVEVVHFPPPETMTQYVKSHGYPGNWFDPTGQSSPSQLGISGEGRSPKEFIVPEGSGLLSHAKPVVDHWTNADSPILTEGGGLQLYINDDVRNEILEINRIGK